ncbi:hypothetical protein HPB48_002912 [Haemaphysalis longicornis]|uniref:Transposable element P transposase-like RNase H domain-containing protein n=1 Tax=Haemaphysalis longicornis TaxID=44386 RepID=A0A9J6FDJ5_HAELO|nr:hypothetical protein HPB48_002912 [Haemaphysalis longicornis]
MQLLRQNLQYDAKNYVISGYSDDGMERTAGMANTAFMAFLSGLSATWIQLLAFIVAKTKLRAEAIKRL